MADHGLATYLNDHLAGAMFGSDLAGQLKDRSEGGSIGELMQWLAPAVEKDRQTLIDVMDRLEVSKSAVKQAATWVAEKASRPKFGGVSASESGVGTFMALETLSLGVEGKRSLWIALREVSTQYPRLRDVEFDALIERAEVQRTALERERVAAGRQALAASDEDGEEI
jgi:hypothetical protein